MVTELLSKFYCFFAAIGFTWLEWFLTQKRLKNRVFFTKKYWGQKGTWRYLLKNTWHKNQNIPSDLYWAKICCIFLEQQCHCPWISLTSSTELKSSFPLPREILSNTHWCMRCSRRFWCALKVCQSYLSSRIYCFVTK